MEVKNSLILNEEFLLYCEINNIEDIESFSKEVFEIGFNFKKYGTKPGEKRIPPSPPPPPPRIIKEGKRPETLKEYEDRYEKLKEKHKKLYDE